MKNIFKMFAIFIVLILGLSVILLSYHIAGWRAFDVQSASMEPTIRTGSMVISHQIPVEVLQKNDIITFIRPDKTTEFVTHRINQMHKNGNVTIIMTKGDNNKSADNWQLAGGGVVGKVVFTIPYLGYILDFSKTKIGILLLIIIPAIFIIYDEIISIVNLLKHKTVQKTGELALVLFFIFSLGITFTSKPTSALLSDTAILNHNLIAVEASQPDNGCYTTVTVTGNGSGSTNTVTTDDPCPSQDIHQSNNTTVINSINTSANSGGNKIQGNNTILKTGDANNNVSVMTTIDSNNAIGF